MYSALLASGVAAILLIKLLKYIVVASRKDLRDLPGPFLARFSGLYRVLLVVKGEAPARYRQLHDKYGVIVRTGPNHVSISDSSMIPFIYGIGGKFLKVKRRQSPGHVAADFGNSDAFLLNHGHLL